jgi:NhaP-type Na+/H+ or K+/H+ antiporter
MEEPPRSERGLFKVIVFATSLSFGVLAAFMVSMKGFFGGEVSFEFSMKTIAGFVGGCALGWLFWRLVRALIRKADKDEDA